MTEWRKAIHSVLITHYALIERTENMPQKALTIYTPPSADPHITADDDAFIYASLCGVKNAILGDLTCVRIDDNTVRLSGGGAMVRGHILRIPDGDTLDLTVAAGTAGVTRYDSVVAEFIKSSDSAVADSLTLKVVQGTSSPPSLVYAGITWQIELYRLTISGTTLTAITKRAGNVVKSPRISSGTAAPSGGIDGDIYFKIVE